MENETMLRQHLVKVLTGSEAHADFEAAIKGMPVRLRGLVPAGAEHSPWMLVEHLQIALWDILEFSRNPRHVSPKWPEGYWPASSTPEHAHDWDKTVQAFRDHLKAMCDLVMDPSTDLFAKIPHGDGQTILREALLSADHNAYHIGQLVTVRRLLGAWE
jgi:DinB superfamily